MEDLIRRSDAIKAIIEYADTHTFNSYNKGMHKAVSIIEDIPSADRWIPCLERLPEHGEDVLITNEYGDVEIASIEYFSRIPEPWKGVDDD